ncbi:MAG: hypothetical protein JXA67_00740 [Micromonosporaceae bacterium]|nr:hypothetical protein [Micromonosporaceae bacterium]
MADSWRTSADVLTRLLLRHGCTPDAVADPRAAWRAFGEFLQIPFGGLDQDPDSDAFIVEWGRYSWHGHRLCLSLTRQFMVAETAGPDSDPNSDPNSDPGLWQIELTMVFDERDVARTSNFGDGTPADSGFMFTPPGPGRQAEFAAIERHPQVKAALGLRPAGCGLVLERV